ncbi:class I mannose-6-phosphate isomerase [Arthrobacter sp. MMS18-M83]|uniref:class I mannose-6-phosphate isomerase n=1 Tax=Arthrobacter sp. MMS18-M83 TaxID=2996261 RepID=UPI00227D3A29|nr:class I mannose-6-phosphate isomerase [Arthrobacter sp. MMS18-M83]WAH97283.1 class I mannose-6-phosphate isomerase [Arthrobacter sp. MMS18-M83]
MDLIVLPSNRPANRFYRGGRQITEFRGEPPAESHEPEDWIASTTSVFGEPGVGITTLPNGVPMPTAIERDPQGLLGVEHLAAFGPDTRLLVKLLDAGQRLPVHAHPDGSFAATHLGHAHGKAEAWYILRGGTVHLGLNRDVEGPGLRNLVERQDSESLLSLLNPVDVAPGDVVFVPPCQLHAIGQGVFLLEVQEPEDLSILLEWRDFDLDDPAKCHLGLGFDLALNAVSHRHLDQEELDKLFIRAPKAGSMLPRAADPYFRIERILVDGWQEIAPGFAVLVAVQGDLAAAGEAMPAGRTAIAPHSMGPIAVSGHGELLVCRPPSPEERAGPRYRTWQFH